MLTPLQRPVFPTVVNIDGNLREYYCTSTETRAKCVSSSLGVRRGSYARPDKCSITNQVINRKRPNSMSVRYAHFMRNVEKQSLILASGLSKHTSRWYTRRREKRLRLCHIKRGFVPAHCPTAQSRHVSPPVLSSPTVPFANTWLRPTTSPRRKPRFEYLCPRWNKPPAKHPQCDWQKRKRRPRKRESQET
jgi:hypothetical protein